MALDCTPLPSLYCVLHMSSTSEASKHFAAIPSTHARNALLGRSADGVTSFKGIPYAKPPVGELRWKAPQAPDPSDEEIECYNFGYTALQPEWHTEPASYYPKSEDCLTLNIWESDGTAGSGERKPVMVYFHGGAYGWGGTTDPIYDGQNFAKAHGDVILVTCNYRLGLMSFADFSQVEGGEEYQDINLGIRDHIAALQWIQKNIAAFGGDPGNVTIFGESAGAWSTTALTISPKARGLFKRAIAQSGEVAPKSRKAAQAYADFIMEASGAKNMDELLAISGDEWMKLDAEKHIADECCYVVVDGDIIPEDLDKAFEDTAKSGFVTETWRYEILDFADRFADAGGDVRVYLWMVPSTKDIMFKSAVHAVELAYVFNNLENVEYSGEVDPAVASKAQESWVNFAKTGDPSISEAEWKAYDTDTRDTMVIAKDGWACVSGPSKTARELLDKAYGDEPYHVW